MLILVHMTITIIIIIIMIIITLEKEIVASFGIARRFESRLLRGDTASCSKASGDLHKKKGTSKNHGVFADVEPRDRAEVRPLRA